MDNQNFSIELNNNIKMAQEALQSVFGDRIPKAYLQTFGCQQNVVDGEKLKGMLAMIGYSMCDSPETADIVIYNTCAVRENPETSVFGRLGALKKYKDKNENFIIGVCGCMTQQDHIVEKIKHSYPFVDLVFGTHGVKELPCFIYDLLSKKKRVLSVKERNPIAENIPAVYDNNTKVGLPIMYGCNNFCSYCVVPLVRGREISRKSDDIVAEFKALVENGAREITLLGQNVNSYGKGLDENIDFAKLLRRLNAIEGDFWIRFISSHPKDVSLDLIDAIAECEKVCNHLHLPVQSGSNRILKLMNRHYTRERYIEIIKYARQRVHNISVTSDIIVGFPGETEEDFDETISLVRKVKFESLFSFIYSKRVGTKAALMPDDTTYEQKNHRYNKLLKAQREIAYKYAESLVGNECVVLVDGEGRSDRKYLSSRNEQNIIIDLKGESNLIGNFVKVRITESLGWALIAEII